MTKPGMFDSYTEAALTLGVVAACASIVFGLLYVVARGLAYVLAAAGSAAGAW